MAEWRRGLMGKLATNTCRAAKRMTVIWRE